jgi:S1-C subfamily serine protease
MKLCQTCGQMLAEEITACPSCGSEVAEGRKSIDDYRILDVLHEGYASILCRAVKEGAGAPVMLRIFTPRSGVDEKIAGRLKQELEELKKLPEDYFVQHYEIRKSSDGVWYRISEWIEAESWTNLMASGFFQDYHTAFRLFARIASILEGLHRTGHFIPHLILYDIIPFRNHGKDLQVKIDYKLSRFLDSKMDRPGPMLKKLLISHPDIVNGRPLDTRSDIWSLGKIFVELLTANLEVKDVSKEIEELSLPREAEILIKLMLADDPDLRPRSMAKVEETLTRIKEKDIHEALRRSLEQTPSREIRGIKRWIRLLAVLVILLTTIGLVAWFHFTSQRPEVETELAAYANQYAGSVAFVLVEYWLESDEKVYYRNRTEGTAFLADSDGYLLTNRHVACPWLEDNRLFAVLAGLRRQEIQIRLGYRSYLWFEGQKAFKRLPGLTESEDLEDRYAIEEAYSSVGNRRLTISGVGKAPEKTWQQIKAPLRDDFAVLKIDPVPEGLLPLPLDHGMDPLKVPKLLPVITLGFPLGSRTQEMAINVSVTTGHVRRAFENFLQVDTSLYRGNSGGPLIDIHGKVIGIASSVAVDWAAGPLPVATPLSDLGMVLPITGAAAFLMEIKAGRVKWNGVLDLSVDSKIGQITQLSGDRQWEAARELADKELQTSLNPSLIMAAAMTHFFSGDRPGAAFLFDQAASMDADNGTARLMLYIIDWLNGRSDQNRYRREFLSLDWRSSQEFYAHLVRVIEGLVAEESALAGGYSAGEKSWLHYVVGLRRIGRSPPVENERLFKEAVYLADGTQWIFFLSLSELDRLQKKRLAQLQTPTERNAYQAEIQATDYDVQIRIKGGAEKRSLRTILYTRLKEPMIDTRERREVLGQLLDIDPSDCDILMELIYADAMIGEWDRALDNTRLFLEIPGRENRGRLSVGLLEPELLRMVGRDNESAARLTAFIARTSDNWYRDIAACLQGQLGRDALTKAAAENPVYILTAHMALGLWDEVKGNKDPAIAHYREALSSYMDELPEYRFALERIRFLRQRDE